MLESARAETAPAGPAAGLGADTSVPRAAPGPVTHHPVRPSRTKGGFDIESPAYVAVRGVGFSALLVIIGVVSLEYLVSRAVGRRGRAGREAVIEGVRGRSAVIGAAAAGLGKRLPMRPRE